MRERVGKVKAWKGEEAGRHFWKEGTCLPGGGGRHFHHGQGRWWWFVWAREVRLSVTGREPGRNGLAVMGTGSL